MVSEPVTIEDELLVDPDPGAEPDYWLENYPLLTLALADQDDEMTAQDAAELLAGIVNEASDHGTSGLDDSTVLGVYVDSYVATAA